MDPNHPDRPRREGSHPQEVSIHELEQVTESSLADFYAASTKNHQKMGYMQDLFEVARLEERFRRGNLRKTASPQPENRSLTSRSTWLYCAHLPRRPHK